MIALWLGFEQESPQLYTQSAPFPNVKSDHQVIALVMRGTRPTSPQEAIDTPGGFWQLIERCWVPEPESRPSAHSLLTLLPLRSAVLSSCQSDAIPHANWEAPTSVDVSPSDQTPNTDPIHVLDPCLLRILYIDTPFGISPREVPARIRSLGGPEEIIRFAQERLDIREGETSTTTLKADPPVEVEDQTSTSIRTSGLIEPHGDPLAERMTSLETLAIQAYGLGTYTEAIQQSRAAIELCQTLVCDEPDKFDADLAECQLVLVKSYSKLDRMENVVECSREAAEIWRPKADKNPDRVKPWLASSLYWVAHGCRSVGDFEDAVRHGKEAVKIYRDLVQVQEVPLSDYIRSWQLALALRDLALTRAEIGEGDKALQDHFEGMEIWRGLAQERPNQFNPDLAESLFNVATSFYGIGGVKGAIEYGLQSLKLYEVLAEDDPHKFSKEVEFVKKKLTSTFGMSKRML